MPLFMWTVGHLKIRYQNIKELPDVYNKYKCNFCRVFKPYEKLILLSI